MKKQVAFTMLLLIVAKLSAQAESKVTKLFQDASPLEIQLSYSNKELRKDTNDSTYIDVEMKYKEGGEWKLLPVALRARGNFRRAKCYFPPVKMKIKKSLAMGTLFEGNKKLKLVLPCMLEKNNNDNIEQELLAYKLYEKISPYHFKTRKVKITMTELKGKKVKEHTLDGFLIEDDKHVANRFDGKVFERYIHPLAMDADSSVKNAFFQFLIGNTDFSVAYQHNGKLLYIDKKIIPLPYDFDMAGLVDASYATVNTNLGIQAVTDRVYRGFKRDEEVLQSVRAHFLNIKSELMSIVEATKADFDMESEYESAAEFVSSFYNVMEDESVFREKILEGVRTK
ncbi:MAG: hypothetical protein ACON47_08740 [Flavobacteriaceae bacterium]